MIERYSRPEMRALWTDDARYGFWLRVELAVCEVLAERGVIPKRRSQRSARAPASTPRASPRSSAR